jgi:hypothetical protein
MSGTVTLAELLTAKNYSQLTHPCAICRKPVWLTNNTPTHDKRQGRSPRLPTIPAS